MVEEARTDKFSQTRIMVINDDLAYLELMKEFLTDHDFEVEIYVEPDVTLTRIKAFRPALLIIDLIFGKEPNGWLLLQHLHNDQQTRDVPVLMCSAAVEQMRARTADFAEWPVDFLEKPFDLTVMQARVMALLDAANP